MRRAIRQNGNSKTEAKSARPREYEADLRIFGGAADIVVDARYSARIAGKIYFEKQLQRRQGFGSPKAWISFRLAGLAPELFHYIRRTILIKYTALWGFHGEQAILDSFEEKL